MNVRPRLLTSTFVTARMSGMSANTKTHYETLEVNPRATQGEIKSAYFKLSKQYHPDKNSSEAATAKFRDIADAYAVVGNYATRKSYDRSILTKTRYQGAQSSDRQEDPKMKYYQAQAALYRQTAKSGSAPLYDFDAWTKAHYGMTFERTMRDKHRGAQRRMENEFYRPAFKRDGKDIGVLFFCVGLVIVFILAVGTPDPYEHDRPLPIPQNNELDTDGQDKSEKFPVVLLSSDK